MEINKILLVNNNITPKIKENKPKQTQNNTKAEYTYNPFTYRDFNISFGERLFRTPANFFEQDFNRNNMPVTMKRYLFADYEDRQNMPPVQMLKLVFDDINLAKNLDEVQYLYPEEPLFANLTDKPKIKARTGIIAEIEMMKDEGKTLFKNGQDNLGFYIVKKIYLEGKSLKEINSDFVKDISVHYKGLSPIGYETLAAYGIKFPKNSFWKSFLATRQDFPYEYKPRKPIEERVTGHKGKITENQNITTKPKKKFDRIQDWQIDKLSSAMLEGNGDCEKTKRSLKKNSAGDPEALNFVAKYMGEINSVVLEKLHVSEEMKDFFENYENLSDSQKVKFKKYWENPDTKDLRSLVMSSTIRFFMDVYGADGNNDEFRELLDYAHSIKPNRIKAQEEHDKLQTEYEELFANYVDFIKHDNLKDLPVPIAKTQNELFEDKIREKAKEFDGKIYTYELSNGTKIAIVGNYEEMVRTKVNNDMRLFPQPYRDSYARFFIKQGSQIPKFFLSLFYNVEGLKEFPNVDVNYPDAENKEEEFELFKKEYMIPQDELSKISQNITKEFNNRHEIQFRAADQILNELLFSMEPTVERYKELTDAATLDFREQFPEKTDAEIRSMALRDIHNTAQRFIGKKIATLDIVDIHRGLEFFGADYDTLKPIIEQKYAIYTKPLTPKEKEKICKIIMNYIENFDEGKSLFDDKRSKAILKSIALNFKTFPTLKRAITRTLIDFNVLPSQNGDYRTFLLSDSKQELLEAKAEVFFAKYLNDHPDALLPLIAIDKKVLDNYIAPVDMRLYNEALKYRLIQSNRI